MTAFRYVVAAAAALLAVPATASAQQLVCGATITKSTTLRADLVNCPGDGLVVGKDNITLDLGRRTVDGTGNGVGIRLAGRRGVRIVNGTVREFGIGIGLDGARDNRVSGVALHGHPVRGIDASNGSDGNVFEGLSATGNRNAITLNGSSGNVVRLSELSRNAITGIALIGASRNHVTGNRIADNGYNGAVVVEGSDGNEVALNSIRGGEAGIIVDTAARNLVTLNRVDGAADGILVSGDANTVAANAVDGARGGCDGCFGYGIGVLSGARNVVKANVVTRSAADGINAVERSGDEPSGRGSGTWIGFNVALRNGALGINAPGAIDGGGNRSERCAGVRCR
jgi:parallel beta-helix repeat protein